jgi:hypothetical protein
MTLNTWIGIAIAIAAAATSSTAGAQKMYRCGNTYQETPCTGNQTATKELRASSAPTATASAGSDADCSRLAEESQKISWAREAGATAEKQMADLDAKGGGARDKAEQRRLIESVYRKRGTAPEVRASIERDCLAEREKMRQAAELARAAAVMSGNAQAGTSPAQSAQAAQDAERQAERARKNAEQQQAQEKQRQCAKYRSQLADIEARYRGGSSSQTTLSNLRDQRSKTEAKAREEGCEY